MMYARVTIAQVQPGKTGEGVSIVRDSVLPAAKQQKGFKGLLQLTDPATGKAITVTLWETKADLDAGEASGYYQSQLAIAAALLTGQPVHEIYEVSVQA